MAAADEPLTLQVLSSQGEIIYFARLPAPGTSVGLTREQLAFYTGWTMGVLSSPLPASPAPAIPLRTVAELPRTDRMEIEYERLLGLLKALAISDVIDASELAKVLELELGDSRFVTALEQLHLAILGHIAVDAHPETDAAYQLGLALRKTILLAGDLPVEVALARNLSRRRISSMQGRLAALSAHFPPHAAAVVAASMGRWSEFAEVVLIGQAGRTEDYAESMLSYLEPQVHLWLTLLAGIDTTAGLRGSVKVSRKVLRRYGPVLLVTAAVLGAVLYLTTAYANGVVKVVASIVAVGASLGISAKGIGSVIGTLISRELKQPIFHQGEEEAMVWAITTLPRVRLSPFAVWRLRRVGVEETSGLGHL